MTRAWPHLFVALLAAVAVLAVATRADAATYLTACPDPAGFTDEAAIAAAASCAALAERSEAGVAAVEALAAADPPPPSTSTVELSAADASRLDLTWSGVWFTGGVAFGVWAFRRLGREATRWGMGT